jgi:murein DD-endopeptidase MepM/ murein hydrolase activator NlpD
MGDDDDHTITDPPDPPTHRTPVDGFAWPATGEITSRFGMRISPIDGKRRLHAGIDLGIAEGTPVLASKAGTVTRAENDPVFGFVVMVNHGDGYETLYAHNSRLEMAVGAHVQQGQELSRSGSTGWATGPHLHFEIHYQGTPVDPMLLLGR